MKHVALHRAVNQVPTLVITPADRTLVVSQRNVITDDSIVTGDIHTSSDTAPSLRYDQHVLLNLACTAVFIGLLII